MLEALKNSTDQAMNSLTINTLAQATLQGSMPFPEIVGQLIDSGVESYHVDYAAHSFTFYSASGQPLVVPFVLDNLSLVSADFDGAALRAAILDSQQHGQAFTAFCERAVRAGVLGYFAHLRGKRVTYFGRQGDQHTEWFPGARPAEA